MEYGLCLSVDGEEEGGCNLEHNTVGQNYDSQLVPSNSSSNTEMYTRSEPKITGSPIEDMGKEWVAE